MEHDNSSHSDPFADISKLRMSQDFADGLGVERVLTRVTVGKPDKQAFFRVHPGTDFLLETAVVQLKAKGETYLADQALWPALGAELDRVILFTAITRQGSPFIWPIRLPGPDGKHHEAHRVQMETAKEAMHAWMRMTWNDQTRSYDVFKTESLLNSPNWPKASLTDLLRVAFKDRFIRSLDHPVLKELRGEV